MKLRIRLGELIDRRVLLLLLSVPLQLPKGLPGVLLLLWIGVHCLNDVLDVVKGLLVLPTELVRALSWVNRLS